MVTVQSRVDLDNSKWQKYTCFNDLITQSDVVNYLINTNVKFKNTYEVYQDLLYAISNNNYKLLENTLYNRNNNISTYIKTSIKTLKKYLSYIKSSLSYPYHNEYAEGNNNFIKVLKKITFGFKSFRRFKARIMIYKGLINSKEREA